MRLDEFDYGLLHRDMVNLGIGIQPPEAIVDLDIDPLPISGKIEFILVMALLALHLLHADVHTPSAVVH